MQGHSMQGGNPTTDLRAKIRREIASDLSSLFETTTVSNGSSNNNNNNLLSSNNSSYVVSSILDNVKVLTKRLLERDDFVNDVLSGTDLRPKVATYCLPLGVQKTLLRSINERRSKWGIVSRGPDNDEDHFMCNSDNSYLQQLLSEWYAGSKKPEDVVLTVEKLAKAGRIDLLTARSAISRIIKQSSAAVTTAEFDSLKRIQCEARDFSLHSIRHIVTGTNGDEIEIISCNYQRVVISQTLLIGGGLHGAPVTPVSVTPYLYYRAGGEGVNFSFECVPPLASGGGELGGARPVLVIGDIIRASIPDPCDRAPDTVIVLEVDTVISVAVFPRASDEILSFAVLLEGRLVGGNSQDAYEFANNDTASEMASEDDDSNSSCSYSDNEDGELQRQRPAFLNTVGVRYYVVFATAYNGKVTISSVAGLRDSVLLDQTPLGLTMCNGNEAMVCGTNGLLARCSGAVAMAMVPDDGSQGAHHLHDSCLTAVAYCPSEKLTVSGDDKGSIFVYHDGAAVAASAHCLGRIAGLWLSESGNRLVVALYDRLLLYSVRRDGGRWSLLLLATLDVVDGHRVRYSVAFVAGGNLLRIWRLLPSLSGGINVTCWSHDLLQCLAGRFASSGPCCDRLLGPFDSPDGARPNPAPVTVSSDPMVLQLFRSCGILSLVPQQAHVPPGDDIMACVGGHFAHNNSPAFLSAKPVIAVILAYQSVGGGGGSMSRTLLASALDAPVTYVEALLASCGTLVEYAAAGGAGSDVSISVETSRWFSDRPGQEFWCDVQHGHSLLAALFLRFCSNKSVAVESPFQSYLSEYGPAHLRRSSRTLREATRPLCIRKIDETANLRNTIPAQLGYVTGLQEIYARRVGLCGCIPVQLAELTQLRVLSMGNNRLTGIIPPALGQLKHLQRIVLHQNNLIGEVPEAFKDLGCIVNVAGNRLLEQGRDVPASERRALVDVFTASGGGGWFTKAHWCSVAPVHTWYKVGVMHSRVHSIVMSSNNMDGSISSSIAHLTQLRMIELATMPLLVGPIPKTLYSLSGLRRLCICRCGLGGGIASDVGNLLALEELQLFGNSLTGIVPASVSKLVNLKLLSLGEYTGGNNFDPQPLPPCIQHLTKLEALFMANCNLTGPLPHWIGALSELRQLDLQRNSLCGQLPTSISSLTQLLYLNLKDNNDISGQLPVDALCCLTRLNRLSLVHCSFSNAERAEDELARRLPRCKLWL